MVVTPHVRSEAMRYRQASSKDLAARVQLFVVNRSDKPIVFDAASRASFDGAPPKLLRRRMGVVRHAEAQLPTSGTNWPPAR